MKIFSDNRIYLFDGAMGTEIMKHGIEGGGCFEELNLTMPDIITSIHKSYVEAGADIIETNTFGTSMFKLSTYGLESKFKEINTQAVKLARDAASGKALVAASMGPLGDLLEPMGKMSFDQAYEQYSALAVVLEEAGADLFSIETMSDLQEARAALIAVKQNTKLPVIVHMTYDANGKTISGTSPEVAAAVFSAIGADAIGANCSTGPEGMLNIAKRLIKSSTIPVSIMANAGNPEFIDDLTVYKMTPEKYAPYAKKIAEMGVKFIGGCCGTTPRHIAKIRQFLDEGNYKLQITNSKQGKLLQGISKLASRTEVLEIRKSSKVYIVGERINPTNRKDLQEQLKTGKSSMIRLESVSQAASGADMLDINVGFPEIDETVCMKNAVFAAQAGSSVPLCIDSSNVLAIEEGLKNFAGKALINSVNGKKDSLAKILPLAKKYGAAVIGLAMDEGGIKSAAEDRFAVANKIVEECSRAGISLNDIFIDVLTLSAGAQQNDVLDTLEAIRMVRKRLGVKTILGVSNVSHGLPGRKVLNSAFLTLAKKYGLDAAIYNPENLKVKPTERETKAARAVFLNKDKGSKEWIGMFKGAVSSEQRAVSSEQRAERSVSRMVIEGDRENIISEIETALKSKKPQDIIDKELLPGMEEVGRRFGSGEYFIPQVMASAEAMKIAFERVKKEISTSERKSSGTVVIATVLGDIHDIGKNIVSMLMENHGFRVIDLGRDVPPSKIIETAKAEKAGLIMLSALLTTTMPQMKLLKNELEKQGLNIPVMVGGAPVTKNFADSMNAGFAKDAVMAVENAKKLIKNV